MKEITIHGGYPLCGEIELSGSKNAALPIIFATLVMNGVSVISRVPDISDVKVAIEIIEKLGASVERAADTLKINTRELHYRKIPSELTSKIRASSYLIGACLARFGIFHLTDFGGCNFCNRPIDMHLFAAGCLGADIEEDCVCAKSLVGAHINFEKPSVGATINALIMASSAKGQTVLKNFAREPHVKNLISFLRSAGTEIEDDGQCLIVTPNPLSGGKIEIIPDMIEAGTFLLMAPMTGGRITVKEADKLELDSFLSVLSDSGVTVSRFNTEISVYGAPTKPFSVTTAPHPGYPTDLQPQIAPLMAKYFGGHIYERVWQNRFSYLEPLSKFGIKSQSEASNTYIYPSSITNAESYSSDLRGGAAAVLCALSAKGESKIKSAEIIFRGYSDFLKKLRDLGAKVDFQNKGDT